MMGKPIPLPGSIRQKPYTRELLPLTGLLGWAMKSLSKRTRVWYHDAVISTKAGRLPSPLSTEHESCKIPSNLWLCCLVNPHSSRQKSKQLSP